MAKITIEFDESSRVQVDSPDAAQPAAATVSSSIEDSGGSAPGSDGAPNLAPRFGTLGILERESFDLTLLRGDEVNAGGPPEWLFEAVRGFALDLNLDRDLVFERRAIDFAIGATELEAPNDAGTAPDY